MPCLVKIIGTNHFLFIFVLPRFMCFGALEMGNDQRFCCCHCVERNVDLPVVIVFCSFAPCWCTVMMVALQFWKEIVFPPVSYLEG